jgi:hypothetical protein
MTKLTAAFHIFANTPKYTTFSLCLRTSLFETAHILNPLTLNDLQGCYAVSPLKIKVPSKKSWQAVLRKGI